MPGGFHPPAAVIAQWPAPNYTNPETRANQLVAISTAFMALTIAVVGARIWVRTTIHRNVGLDDLCIVLALIPTIGITALNILIGTKFRWHRHLWDVPLSELSGRQYHSWVVQILFVFSTSLSKISTLQLCRRLTAGTAHRPFTILLHCSTVAIVIYCVGFLLLMIVQCLPTSSYWLQYSYPVLYTQKFKCVPEGDVPLANAVISVATDFLTTLLPMIPCRKLQLPFREKVALCMVFGIGFLVCIFGIVRTVILYHMFYETYDVTWASHDLWIWMNVENDLLIICTSIPPLRALFRRFFRATSRFGYSECNEVRLVRLPQTSEGAHRGSAESTSGLNYQGATLHSEQSLVSAQRGIGGADPEIAIHTVVISTKDIGKD